MNPFQIFARSWQGLNLSPGERAFMKLVQGWLATGVGAGVAVVVPLVLSGHPDYTNIVKVGVGAGLMSVYMAGYKFLAAQSDVPLPAPSLKDPVPVPEPVPLVPAPKFTTPVPQPPFVPPVQPQFVSMGAPMGTAIQPLPSQFIPMPAAPAPFPYGPSSTYPQMPAV